MKKNGRLYISPIGQLTTVAARGPFTEFFLEIRNCAQKSRKTTKVAPDWLEMLKFYTWSAKNDEYSWWSATQLQRHLADEGGLWPMGPAGNPTGKPMLNLPCGYSPPYIFLELMGSIQRWRVASLQSGKQGRGRIKESSRFRILCELSRERILPMVNKEY